MVLSLYRKEDVHFFHVFLDEFETVRSVTNDICAHTHVTDNPRTVTKGVRNERRNKNIGSLTGTFHI